MAEQTNTINGFTTEEIKLSDIKDVSPHLETSDSQTIYISSASPSYGYTINVQNEVYNSESDYNSDPAECAVEIQNGSLNYELDGETQAYYVVTGIAPGADLSEIKIPPTFGDGDKKRPVKAIKEGAFEVKDNNSNKLTGLTVIIPNTITNIGNNAFKNTEISKIVFEDFEGYTEDQMENDAYLIGVDYTGIQEITCEVTYNGKAVDVIRNDIGDNFARIGFVKVSGITEYKLTISDASTSVEIPVAGKRMQVKVSVDPSNHLTYNESDVITTVNPIYQPKTKIIGLNIGAYAFSGCTNIKKIHIPGRVRTIGESAFAGITIIEANRLTFEKFSILTEIASKGLSGISLNYSGDRTIALPNCVTTIGEGCFEESTGISGIHIPENLTEIPKCFAKDCTNLNYVSGGSKVTTIGEEAFKGCTALKEFRISNAVKIIRKNAFSDCFYIGGGAKEQVKAYAPAISFVSPQRWIAANETSFTNKDYDNWTVIEKELNRLYMPDSDKQRALSAMLSYSGSLILEYEKDTIIDYIRITKGREWRQIDKMPAPTAKRKVGSTIQITDPLGIAETFYLYLQEKDKDGNTKYRRKAQIWTVY